MREVEESGSDQRVFYRKRLVFALVYLVAFVLAVTLVHVVAPKRICQHVSYEIRPGSLKFLSSEKVEKILQEHTLHSLVGQTMRKIPIHALEKHVEKNPFVQSCQIYKTPHHRLIILVQQRQPIARLLTKGGVQRYVDSSGKFFPLSKDHTSHSLLLRMEQSDEGSLTESEQGQPLLDLLLYIYEDEVWRDQIAEVELLGRHIFLYPQVTKQRIFFGNATQVQEKFKKLTLFYQRILPNKGWNLYREVDLRFKGQIVCR